jgi:parallel beta-helix repeat protein
MLAAAMASTNTETNAETNGAAITASVAPASAAQAAPKEDQPTESILAVASALGVTSPATTAANRTTASGRILYVDSINGRDSNTGLAATQGRSNTGPWRSLSKLPLANLTAGETVRLICGSSWNETLKLTASGAASNPITLTAYPAGCTNKPEINGSVAIAAASWTLHQGNIYKTTLPGGALQLASPTGNLQVAHHPNRGFDAAAPDSMYLRLAADSDKTTVNGRQASTYITTGTDLVLPNAVNIASGTTVRIRTNAWMIDESKVAAVSGSKITLATSSTFALTAGWGYYLLGQLWMLDSPGEWYFDASTKLLYAWMPDSRAPTAAVQATQIDTGIDLEGSQYIVIDGLAVRMVGTGINLRRSVGLSVSNVVVEDTVGLGINAAGSQAASIAASSFARTGNDAISGQDDIVPAAIAMQVLKNTITNSGVTMSGNVTLSLPLRSRAAIRPGNAALVSGNALSNVGYIGIWPLANSTVSDNIITGTCLVLDDCGAIYVSGSGGGNITISGNLIQRSVGALAGKSALANHTQAQGIYLDESATDVTVSGNTVTDADNGIHVHVSSNNVIKDNKLYGNRVSQIWLQETGNTVNPKGDLFGNVITGNQIVPVSASAKALFLDTNVLDTTRFGNFDWNRYLDSVYPTVAVENSPAGRSEKSLPQWKAATAAGLPRSLDPNGAGTSQTRFAPVLINGTNVVPNTLLATNTAGWSTWNQTSPIGSLVREACPPGWCVRYITGGSPGILSSPNFSVLAGTGYRLTIDLATGSDGQAVNLLVRRGGGGTNGYERLSDRATSLTAGRTWTRYSISFVATKTINAGDPITKDWGARVDVENIQPGQWVSVANLELVPITPAEALTRSDLLLNASNNPVQANCPMASSQPALCGQYLRLTDNTAVTWPYYLPARTSEIVYTRDARFVDSDGDGIPDSNDQCAATLAGVAVNSRGCALTQG